ncbi:hypothetical protein BDZ91DRAFT_96169 [Kalaharituber pfeilii]|nr:hypothetical protein BDZ91DRAFT_96169 [Kalaharituber pfeilii]
MTIDLLLQISKRMEVRGLINQPFACPTFQTSPHRHPPFLAIPTHVAIDFFFFFFFFYFINRMPPRRLWRCFRYIM